MPDATAPISEIAALKARAALRRKRVKTPLEDGLAAADGSAAVRLVQWARTQRNDYESGLIVWKANRVKYAQEAADIFSHRKEARERHKDGKPDVFSESNDSLNVVAGLAEFASAQAEQDIYGGDPWFAAAPIGRSDPKLADQLQKHLQWSFRDGRLVDAYCAGITTAVTHGEVFLKTLYAIDVDEYETRTPCLHVDGKPMRDADGQLVTTDEQVATLGQVTGKAEWRDAFEKRQTVIREGVEAIPIHFNDIAFREDAPELDLRYTNVYVTLEMSVLDAKKRFKLSNEDATRLARAAEVGKITNEQRQREEIVDATTSEATVETALGEDENQRMLNSRVRLVEGYVRADVFGTGTESRICIVFPPVSEDWIIWCDYLSNLSPKAELPVKVHVWEHVPHRLYGRGFFGKYSYIQTGSDDLWNQVNYRNRMHANPVVGYHPENLISDEDDPDLVLRPNVALKLQPNKKLGDVLEVFQLPDMDNRSMELFQVGMQMAQLRSGITSASQGDLSAVPENNTATGIRSLMSRAAVLLKKPIRNLRRSLGREFSYAVKIFYSNFNREEAFAWGEGENAEMLQMTPEMVRDLDIDVRMLLTQEQNQTKLEGSQVAMGLGNSYAVLPEIEKLAQRDLYVQAVKALEFDRAEDIIRQAAPTIEDCISILPPDQGQRLQQLLGLEQQMQQQMQPAMAAPTEDPAKQAPPDKPSIPTTAPTPTSQDTTL
jgi:hypothetical protein